MDEIRAFLSKAAVFQTLEEGAFMSSDKAKGGSRFTGKSDFFGAAKSLNAAREAGKEGSLTAYVSEVGVTLVKVIGNLIPNAAFHLVDICSPRAPVAIAGLVANVVAKVFVIVALVACLILAVAQVKIAHKIFAEIDNPKEIKTMD